MGSPSRVEPPSGILQKDTFASCSPTDAGNPELPNKSPCVLNAQDTHYFPHPTSRLPAQPHSSSFPSDITPSPSAYFTNRSPNPFPRLSIASGPIDLLSSSPISQLAVDAQNYAFAVSDRHIMPCAPPTTPASSVTDSYSSVSSYSTLAIPSPLEQSSVTSPSAPTRSEERSRGRRRSGSRSSTDNRSCYYRTKPCRFFHTSGFCVKGDRCNFIHDYTAAGRNRPNHNRNSEEQSAHSDSNESRGSRVSNDTQLETKRPRKAPLSPAENDGRNNYYPITWRVIGGGVLMGGPREVCQAYLAGCCNEGLDCRFSHPTAADELEHSVAFASPPTESHYAYIDAWSPISPLYINPFAAMQLTPPSPMTEGGCSDTSEKTLTIDTLVARPGSQYFPARVVLDGETLLPRDSPSSHTFIEDDVSSPPNSRSPSPGPFVADEIGARAIVRPVSTPPSTSATASFSKVVRLFAAEMP